MAAVNADRCQLAHAVAAFSRAMKLRFQVIRDALLILAMLFGSLAILTSASAESPAFDPLVSAESDTRLFPELRFANFDDSATSGATGPSADAEPPSPKRDSIQPQFPFFSLPDDNDAAPDASEKSEPDITSPGPDFGDFPNSAFTLKQGRSYLEYAPLSYQGKDSQNPASNSGAYLYRYGVTDNVELRVGGAGLVNIFQSGGTVTGFAPVILDTKVHLWDDNMDRLIPAAGLEVYLQTNLASSGFQGGVQPSLNMNLDFPITKKTNVEMTFGYTGVQESLDARSGKRFLSRFNFRSPTIGGDNLDTYQFSFQWAIEHEVTEKFELFLHGYHNGPVFLQTGPGRVIGAGYFYQLSKRSVFFNSYNAGLDSDSPSFIIQTGISLAF